MYYKVWDIKSDVIDEVVEYLNFVNLNKIIVNKHINKKGNYIIVSVKKWFIKHSKINGVSKNELKIDLGWHVDNVIRKFENDKDWIYENNINFLRYMKLKKLYDK